MFKAQKKNKVFIIAAIIILSLFAILPAKQFVLAQVSPAAGDSGKASTDAGGATSTTPATTTSTTTPSASTDQNSLLGQAASGALGLFVIAIGMVLSAITQLFGKLLIVLIEILVWVSGYNSFINNDYVKQGWVILRDLVNMFFVLGLLFIAFVTVLKIEKYQWNKLLARLLIMAIVVNFSKTICGIIIDFFQVLMMTFVNAYKDIAAGNIMNSVGVSHWFQMSKTIFSGVYLQGNVSAVDQLGFLASQMLSLIFLIVLAIVVVIFIIILIGRIVALWILIVFSPLAFFSWIFEGAAGKLGEFSRQWWSQFLNYCMVGPFLAFFLWISVLTMAKLDPANMVSSSYYDYTKRDTAALTASLSEGSSMASVIKYIVTIIMLVAGLSQTQRFSVVGAGLASGAANWMKNQSVGRLERGARRVGAGAAAAAKAPYNLAVKPRLAGMSEGISQKLQRGEIPLPGNRSIKAVPAGLTKLLTKAGRDESMKQRQAEYQKRYAGGGLDKLNTDMDIASQQDKLHPDVNLKNASQVDTELDKMKEKDGAGNFTGWKSGTDKRWLMRLTMAKADMGKMEYSDVNELSKKGGVLDGMDIRERQVFLEDMENRYEKETGRKKAFSSLVFNEETNQYEDTSVLDENAKVSLQNSGIAPDQMKDIPISKIAKKITDKNDANYGAYKLDENAAEFKSLDAGKQQMLRDLQTKGIGYSKTNPDDGTLNSDFYNVIRAGDVVEKKQGEVKKKMATSNREQFNKASKQADFGDPTKNDVYTGAEMDGGVEQISRVSGMDQAARDNWKAKIEAKFSRGTDRMKTIEANKKWFSKDLQRKDGEDDTAYTARIDKTYASMDKDTDSMDEEQLSKYQNFYKEATYKYDDFGRKQPGSTPVENKNINEGLRRARSTGGITGGISKQLGSYNIGSSRHAQDLVTINNESADMLASTESFDDRNDRVKQIVLDLQAKTSLRGTQATDMANYLLDNEIKVKVRDQSTKGVQSNVRVKLEAIADEADKQKVKGVVNTAKIDLMVNAIMSKLNAEIVDGGLSETALDPAALQLLLNRLKADLNTAPNATVFRNKLKTFRQGLAALGYVERSGQKNQ